MACKVGKKWRGDARRWGGQRLRFDTKAEAEAYERRVSSESADGTYVAPKNIPTLGALADSWIAGRIAQSKTPGAGYRPSSLAQWQTHIAHIKRVLVKIRKLTTSTRRRLKGPSANRDLRKSRVAGDYQLRPWAKS